MVRQFRLASPKKPTQKMANRPYEFDQIRIDPIQSSILIPSVTSERRPYLPVERVSAGVVLIKCKSGSLRRPRLVHRPDCLTSAPRLDRHRLRQAEIRLPLFQHAGLEHVSGAEIHRGSIGSAIRLRTAHSKDALSALPENHCRSLRPGQDAGGSARRAPDNDELLESMYIGRPFRNDTERLEKLFKLYAARVKQGGK